ncbi:MAG: hypothetical protein F4148_11745 [Caldilineaceae bacterium SB0675_bin_29]|uniref:Uncharacterized protein n=1 Tax=Caldilineaceae bacterium SB0675_bin_29 TaxID=2605266 RepID=A0A6B1G1Q5_9CHLR|nr:hypothetical protein [Caldilineaceae bacterium SB0675_bin_29]
MRYLAIFLICGLILGGVVWAREEARQALAAESVLKGQMETLYEAELNALKARSEIALQEKLDGLHPDDWRHSRTLQEQAQALYDSEAQIIEIELHTLYELRYREIVPGWVRWLMHAEFERTQD